MIRMKELEVEWLQFESLSGHIGVIHGFTTRNGGVSDPPFSSLNMGRFTKDKNENIQENYTRILGALGVAKRPRFMTQQVHSDLVHAVEAVEADAFETFIVEKDGLVTSRTDVVLITYYADCVPLFLYDPVNHCGGVVHSGWKGTAKQIGLRAVERMTQLYGTNPKDILAGIGPCASQCCYEIDDAVVDKFQWMKGEIHDYLVESTPSRYMIDLKGINRLILEQAGIPAESIEVAKNCTMCEPDLLYSYRKEKADSGRMAAIFALRPR